MSKEQEKRILESLQKYSPKDVPFYQECLNMPFNQLEKLWYKYAKECEAYNKLAEESDYLDPKLLKPIEGHEGERGFILRVCYSARHGEKS